MGTKNLLAAIVLCFFGLTISAQTDSVSFKLNRLTHENIIENRGEGEIKVVSASRSARKIEDLPVTIHVVTSEQIILNGYITLVDVLKSLPSIKISQPGSAENGEMFMMRGMVGNQYTKILVDNVPLKPSVTTGLPLESYLPIRQAERIEIIYGPASALYGADAAIGVINIITKKPKSSVFSQADIYMGEYGYKYTNFHVGGKAGRNTKILEYSFFGNFMEKHDMNIFNDTLVYHPLSYLEQHGLQFDFGDRVYKPTELNAEILNRYIIPMQMFFHGMPNYQGSVSMPEISNIPSESNLMGFNLKYKKWNISVLNMYRKTHSSLGLSSYLFKYSSPQYYMADRNLKMSFNYNTTFGRINSNTNVILSGYHLDENSSYGVNFIPSFTRCYQYSESLDAFFEQIFTYNHKFLEVIGGISSQFSNNLPLTNYSQKPYVYDYQILPSVEIKIDTSNYEMFGINPYAYVFMSGFMQVYFDLRKFKIVGGIRQEYNTLFSESISNPRLAILYSINNNHSLRLSTGKAYKPPAGNLLFQSLAFPNNIDGETDSVHYATVPNPKLLPEYFESHEFGYRGNFFNRNLWVDFALYYNTVDNLIVSNYIDPRGTYINAVVPEGNELARIFVNTKEATTRFYGIDIAITIRNIYAPKNVNIRLSSSYTNGKETLSTNESIQYLRGIPSYMFKINISGNPSRKTYLNIENTIMSGWQRSFLPYRDYYTFPEYPDIKGYFNMDITYGYRIHNNLNCFVKIVNVFDSNYGGIDATSLDVDLRYNPQLGRSIRYGLSFIMN
jgi:hemoglobin/transferrin/lactoferrin receptor protein